MPAEGKISLDASQYQRTLEEVKSQTAKASNDMSRSMGDFGKTVGKAGSAVTALGAEIGTTFGNVGKVISGVVSGPVGFLIASIGVAIATAKKIYDTLTQSSEEYASQIQSLTTLEQNHYEALVQTQKEEDSYLERLNELRGKESLANEEKDEALTLIGLLEKKYGDLGVKIDETTGKIVGFGNAQKKVNEEQKKELLRSLENQLDLEQSSSNAETRNHFVGGKTHQVGLWLQGDLQSTKDYAEQAVNTPIQERRDMYAGILKNVQGLNSEEIDFYRKQVEHFDKIIDLQNRINSLKETGKETEAEHVAILKQRSQAAAEEEKAEQAARDKAEAEELDRQRKQYEGYQAQIQKQAEEERKAHEAKMQQEKSWAEYQQNNERSLRDLYLRKTGRSQQADIENAVLNATNAKGSDLTGDEYNRIVEMTKARAELNNLQMASPVNFAPRVNSLLARGGSEAPVKMPKVEELQSKTYSSVEQIKTIADKICGELAGFGTI